MAAEKGVILYGYWRSSCSWRVRAALALKNIKFEERSVDIVKENKQFTEQYRNINPSQKVPALAIDDVVLVESMAIIQYLEETRPEPSLTPNTPLKRAHMREICETVVAGIQPLQNFGLKPRFETDEQFLKFSKYFSERGLEVLEDLLKKSAGKYCIGDQISVADICIVPQIYNFVSRITCGTVVVFARRTADVLTSAVLRAKDIPLCITGINHHRYGLELNKYPTVSKLYETLLKEHVFQSTHPENLRKNVK